MISNAVWNTKSFLSYQLFKQKTIMNQKTVMGKFLNEIMGYFPYLLTQTFYKEVYTFEDFEKEYKRCTFFSAAALFEHAALLQRTDNI